MRSGARYLLLAFAVSIPAAPAVAQQVYQLSGSHVHGAGIFAAHFPLAGASCSIFFGETTPPPTPPTPPTPFPLPQRQAGPGGCVPGGAAAVTASAPGAGAALTVPAGFFQRALPPAGAYTAPVPNTPMVVQLATSIAFSGPSAPAPLRADAWTTQAGRAGADFTWCPGNPTCSNPSQGSHDVLVRYHAGPNRFGGTMRMIQTWGPQRASRAMTTGGDRILIQILSGTGARPWGGGYANTLMETPPPGQLWGMHTQTPMGGFQVSSYLAPVPELPRTHAGFPFTTGTVVLRHRGNNLFGTPVAHTITGMGGDSVSSGGARNISLVAGGLTAIPGGFGELHLAQVSLLPEPGRAAGWLAVGATLGALRAGRRRR